MFVYIRARFRFALIGRNLTAQSTRSHRDAVASSPTFSRPAARAPRSACSQVIIENSFQRVRAFQIELDLGSVDVFLGVGKAGVPREKSLGARERHKNKLKPHMASTLGFEAGSHWWEASAFTTAPPLFPNVSVNSKSNLKQKKNCTSKSPPWLGHRSGGIREL